MNMYSIKSAILMPFSVFVILLAGGISAGFYWYDQENNAAQMRSNIESVQEAFQRIMTDDGDLMKATILAMQRIDVIGNALISRDREQLQLLSNDLFNKLKEEHNITHFYFHLPDGVNLLRVHQPSRYGDLIQRYTTRIAMESGRVSSGLELGPLGTFTLRVVSPWFVGNKLIGFIELGEEIDHFMADMQRLFHVDIYVFAFKKGIKQADWETGMKMLGRPAQWDAFSDVILIDQTATAPPPIMSDFDKTDNNNKVFSQGNVQINGRYFNRTRLPILDVTGQEKAFMVIQQDVTARSNDSKYLFFWVIVASFLGGSGLILLFWFLLDRLESKLKRAENQENRLGRILDASMNEIFIFDEQTLRFQDANYGALKSLGYTLDEIRALTPRNLFPEYDEERFNILLEPLRKGDSELVVFETAACRKEKTFYPVDVHLQLFRHEQRPVFVAVVQDITERKRQEEAMLESEARFRGITSSAQDAIIMVDDRDRITYWNKAASRIFGHDEEEATGRQMHQLLAPQRFWEAAAQGIHEFQKTGEGSILNRTVELMGVRKNGEEFPLELSTAALIHRNQWCAIGILRDISIRKEMENKMKLGASVIEHALEGIIITDDHGMIQLVNPAFCNMTGYDVKEVIGRNPSLLQSGRHDETFYQEMWRALKEKNVWQGEVWNRRKSGEIYPEWLSISAIKDEHGRVSNYVGIFSDITQRKELEQYMTNLAFYDHLTAIPNRMLFHERLVQVIREATRRKQQFAILYLDLDFFKEVNDTHGHKVGDLLLQEVAQRLQQLLRKEDTVARLGGDEFAILLRTVQAPQDAVLVATKIITTLTRPFVLQGHECRIGTSIGISLFPSHATSSEALVKNADTAMYCSKKGGRNRYTLYGDG